VTKRKAPEDLKIRARDDLTPTVRKKHKSALTPEAKEKRIAALREKSPNTSVRREMAKANPNRPLSEKARLFVKLWAEGESISSASHRAGYSDSATMAYKMAKDPAVLKIYHAEKALYEQAAQMTRQTVMEGFKEAADMARTLADPVALTGAFREIGKMCGYYEPVKRTLDINLKGDITMKNLERMSDADLLKIVKGELNSEIEDVAFTEIDDDGE
jgi:hypothetical protein